MVIFSGSFWAYLKEVLINVTSLDVCLCPSLYGILIVLSFGIADDDGGGDIRKQELK